MRSDKRWAPGFLFLFGLTATLEALKLTVGRAGSPGPGFFPFFLALAFSLVSLVLLVRSLLSGPNAQPADIPQEPLRRGSVFWTLSGLFVYTFLLEPLGFVLATFLLMLFLFKAVDPLRWAAAVGGSLATSLLTYVLFKLWLQVQLPAGPWGL